MAYRVRGYWQAIVCLKYRPVLNAKTVYKRTVEIYRDVHYYIYQRLTARSHMWRKFNHSNITFEIWGSHTGASWGVTPCTLVDRQQGFGGTCCLNILGKNISLRQLLNKFKNDFNQLQPMHNQLETTAPIEYNLSKFEGVLYIKDH
jgi:hypothetical protein